jgi:tRNA(Ile2)-agmatinylcytidine synthase
MLHIGIDDTDSIKGGCTTWLATEIITELSEFDLIGPPRLVRLNPNVPWKTRGNAAVALTFGKGVGSKTLVGQFEQERIFMYSTGREVECDKHGILKRVSKLVRDGSMPDSQPGIVISDVFLPEGLYWQGVTNIVTEEVLSDAIKGTVSQGYRGSRGIYGAACSIAWTGSPNNPNGISHTWELIGYREKKKWGSKRDISISCVHEIGQLEGVFSCHDSDGKIAMVPNSPCPVLWGFRGTDHKTLINNFENLGPEKPLRWILYKTNQATDDHLRTMAVSDILDGDSVRIEVEVSSKPNIIKGGHRFFKVCDSQGDTVKCAAFEPSKTFRHTIDSLEVGDSLIICGSFKKDTINLEKIRIIDLMKRFSKSPNPICDCGRRTHSSGKGMRYRCKVCGKKYDRPERREVVSNLEIGWYEPPASARRHLTTPVSLMR